MDMRSLCAKASNRSKQAQVKLEKQREEAKRRRELQVGGVYFDNVHPSGIIIIMMDEWKKVNGTSEQKLYKWCQKNKVHYYARKNSETIIDDAVLDAQKVKRQNVLINAL